MIIEMRLTDKVSTKENLFLWWLSGKESACQCKRHKRCGFFPWVGKVPSRRRWQPTPVFLPGKSHGQRSLVGALQESDMTEVNKQQQEKTYQKELSTVCIALCWSLLLLLLLLLSRFSPVWLCATPETAAYQASPSLGFSRQEHWSGLPFPSPMHESKKWKWSCSVVSDS